MCGENRSAPLDNAPSTGSSPRVRGKRDAAFAGWGSPRLIPARAGKTWAAWSTSSPPPAHPRACGENPILHASSAAGSGSSPRVRGKRRRGSAQAHEVRLIPARAGKTARGAAPSRSGGAHPRACGENVPASGSPVTVPGSSPRVRGKHEDDAADPRKSRLIPARAGKTTRSPCSGCPRGAHPRACGENLSKTSPRSPPSWLIPARAGKTCTRSRA